MEPITALGVASAIGGLIDITSRSISTLLDLQRRYSNFSLKINHIAGQLSTIKTALQKIKYLVEVSHDDILQRNEARFFALEDPQLVIRLGLSVDGCENLIRRLDEQLGQFQLTYSQLSGSSTLLMKMKFLWEENDMNQYQDMLNNQINALNLLLTVTTCESVMEQRNLLRMESSRRVFELVRDDTSSLLLQRDKDSILSRQSSAIDDSSLNEIEFGFDGELFNSKPYLSAARSWMCQAMMSRRKHSLSKTTTASAPSVNENDSVNSDTSTLVVANDDDIEVMTVHSVAVPYSDTTPLPAIPEQPSKTEERREINKKKTTFKMPQISNISLGPYRSIRMRTAAQYYQRAAAVAAYQQQKQSI